MLRVGVFGTGHLGKFHLNNWKEMKDIELVGFFDPNDTIAAEVAQKYRLKRFDKPGRLDGSCDLVDIIAPTPFHFELCEQAIRKGKHVFVEKPLANTMPEAKELVKLVHESNVKLQVGHVERFNPAFLALRDMALNPMFIEVHRLAQFNPRGTEVSVILDLMIHDIDIILTIVKSEVKNISASGVAVMTDTPDIANVRIEFNNGCVVNLTSSRISMKKMRKMRLFQKDAYIGIDFLNKKTEVIKLRTEQDLDAFSFDIETMHGKKTIAVINPMVPEVNAIRMELETFLRGNSGQYCAGCFGMGWIPGDGHRPPDPAKNKTQYHQYLSRFMKVSKKIHIIWYILADYLAALATWIILYFTRRYLLSESIWKNGHLFFNNRFWLGFWIIPIGWLVFYAMVGCYNNDIYKKSRLNEFTLTAICSVIGCTILFFAIVINDPQTDYRYYYKTFFTFLSAQFIITFLGRWILLQITRIQLEKSKIKFNVLLIGSDSTATKIYQDSYLRLLTTGYHYVGYLNSENQAGNGIEKYLSSLGMLRDLEVVIDRENIELVVIAMDKSDKESMEKIIERLSEKDVEIKIIPSILDILSGSVKTSNVLGAALSDIQTGLIPEWQQNIKRLVDILISVFGLIILSPLLIYSALRVKFSSPGPIIYSQERIGYKGKKFFIYKFRSMFNDAEKDGPALSSGNDERITSWGRIMRKWRIDELPQLWNILKGEMSLVGPRPERQFYINRILNRHPISGTC